MTALRAYWNDFADRLPTWIGDAILVRDGAHRTEQPAQPLAAGLLERHLAARDERVQLLELGGVQVLEVVQRKCLELGMGRMQFAQRRAGADAMIEQRVVEIEEDGAQHVMASGSRRPQTAVSGCRQFHGQPDTQGGRTRSPGHYMDAILPLPITPAGEGW